MHIIEYRFLQIFKYMGLTENEIRPEASFKDDFGFEEFQFGYLVFYIGSYFRINIRESDYAELNTIGSTMDFVKRKIRKRDRLKISRRKIRPAETLKSIPRIFHSSTRGMTIMTLPQLSYLPMVADGIII